MKKVRRTKITVRQREVVLFRNEAGEFPHATAPDEACPFCGAPLPGPDGLPAARKERTRSEPPTGPPVGHNLLPDDE